MSDEIHPRPGLTLTSEHWSFRASRAGGPGGQHVNTSATRVELLFDVMACPALNSTQRTRILEQAGSRCTAAGVIRLVTGANRSQRRNKLSLIARLETLIAEALKPKKTRRATKPTKASKSRRLDGKKKRSKIKKDRQRPFND